MQSGNDWMSLTTRGGNRPNFGKRRRGRPRKDRSIARTRKDINQDKRLANVEKRINKINKEIELKYVDTLFTTPATATGALTLLNALAFGDEQVDRSGAQVRMTSVQWRLLISSLTATVTATNYRFLIVLDRQPNGAAPTVAGSPLGGVPAVLDNSIITTLLNSPYQYENKMRFKILHDERGVLSPGMTLSTNAAPATAVIAQVGILSGYIKLNHTVKYDAGTAVIDSINTNSLYAIFITDVANGILVSGGSRVYYKDP